MADTTADIYTPQFGTTLEGVIPVRWAPPLPSSSTCYAGQMVGLNATTGNAQLSSFTATTKILGVSDKEISNITPGPTFPSNAKYGLFASVVQGAFYFAFGAGADAITSANVGQSCYAIDNVTVGLTDGGGTRPYAGIIRDVPSTGPGSGKVGVLFGIANPWTVSDPGAMSTSFRARAVMTSQSSMSSYTGSGTGTLTAGSNGAMGAQDGVTLAVGDVVIIPAVVTGFTVATKDIGPWVVTSLGGASSKVVLTRPAWWTTGATIAQGQALIVSGEGTVWSGSEWRALCGKSKVVDTDDPVLYPRVVKGAGAVGTQVTGAFIWTGAQCPQPNDTTAAHAVKAAFVAGYGTGTIDFTGTGTDAVSYVLTNF